MATTRDNATEDPRCIIDVLCKRFVGKADAAPWLTPAVLACWPRRVASIRRMTLSAKWPIMALLLLNVVIWSASARAIYIRDDVTVAAYNALAV